MSHLQPSDDISLSVGQRLALLLSDVLRQLLQVASDECLQLEHALLASQQGGLPPRLEGVLARVHRLFHLLRRGVRHLRDHFICGLIRESVTRSLRETASENLTGLVSSIHFDVLESTARPSIQFFTVEVARACWLNDKERCETAETRESIFELNR